VASSTNGEAARDTVRVGIDIGGTFTDAVLVGGDSEIVVSKTPSRPRAPGESFVAGLKDVLAQAGLDEGALGYLVHGTTVATNAVVQGRLARVALLTTRGFGDVLEIGTQQRQELYDLTVPRPRPLVPAERRIELDERLSAEGQILKPLGREEVIAAVDRLAELEVEAVAVCFLFSFVDDRHERLAGEVLAERLPNVPVSLSCEVAPEYREYVRTSTTVLNAALQPVVGRYVGALAEHAAERPDSPPLHLMQSNGGITTAEVAGRLPIGLLASGPAAGAIGGARLAELVDESNVLTFDMGGTTADVAMIVNGHPELRFRGEAVGHPINQPQLDVLSVGAGGGSIASVDAWGNLAVGPQSAGSDPGPAAYGRGGTEPTVTDAHLVLGTLASDRFLGGQMALNLDAAREAVEREVGKPLGLDVEAAAAAVIAVANAEMIRALNVITVARGHDPRQFALVALGGAGALHACAIATEVGIRTVVVPRYPGLASAHGLLLSDVRHDLRRSWVRSAQSDEAALGAALRELGAAGHRHLDAAGVPEERQRVTFEVDMRYRGQAFELTVASSQGAEPDRRSLDSAFHEAHRNIYGHAATDWETEIVTLRAQAVGTIPEIAWNEAPRARNRSARRTRMVWTGTEHVEHRVLDRNALGLDDTLKGPAIIEQEDSTVLLPARWRALAMRAGTLVLRYPGP
jgi:N-methylhydantoinase A